jgi:hypothetical protein
MVFGAAAKIARGLCPGPGCATLFGCRGAMPWLAGAGGPSLVQVVRAWCRWSEPGAGRGAGCEAGEIGRLRGLPPAHVEPAFQRPASGVPGRARFAARAACHSWIFGAASRPVVE